MVVEGIRIVLLSLNLCQPCGETIALLREVFGELVSKLSFMLQLGDPSYRCFMAGGHVLRLVCIKCLLSVRLM